METTGLWAAIYALKWALTAVLALALGVMLAVWFHVKAWKLAATAVPVALLALGLPEQPLLAFSAGVIGLSILTSTDP